MDYMNNPNQHKELLIEDVVVEAPNGAKKHYGFNVDVLCMVASHKNEKQ